MHIHYVIAGLTSTDKPIRGAEVFERKLNAQYTCIHGAVEQCQLRPPNVRHVHHRKSDIAVINAHKVDYY